jgi:diaminohydroxyphosphoribosylaminopyrimidine deaminase/5-amino-6-(5-phosphoribosylamino)uracil reductase
LIAAGIARCVVSIVDPDPRIAGRGLARLEEAGILVQTGTHELAATRLNQGYLTKQRLGRPMVALKIASSLDGRTATAGGHSKWITGAPARAFGHWLRAIHDAVAVGSGTVLADDPELSCRLAGLESRSPVCLVLDRRGRTPANAKVFSPGRPSQTWVATAPEGRLKFPNQTHDDLQFIDIKETEDSGKFLNALLLAIAGRGITRLLVEGGATIAAAFLRAGLVDRLYWLRSAGLIGGDGLAAVSGIGVFELAEQLAFHRSELRTLGEDVLEVFDFAA